MISQEQAEFNAVAAARYMSTLSPEAMAYLNGRGISGHTIAQFKLGQVDGSFPEHSDFEGRISVPYLTKLGGVQRFKFRRVGDGEGSAKYLTDYSPHRLYNTLAFERAEALGYIAICEGESDTWTVDGECGIPAVGIPGSDTWKSHPEWRLLFDGFRRVMFFNDPDTAGSKLKDQVLRDVEQAFAVNLDDSVDVNSVYQAKGREFIRAAAGV
jgi:DNA primase